MTSIVVRCDGCGVDLDTDQRFDGVARHIAYEAGWSVPPSGDWRREGPDYCPACGSQGMVSNPAPQPPLIVEQFMMAPGKVVTFTKTANGWTKS